MDRIGTARDHGLSSVLRGVNVRSVVYCLSDFTTPWGFSVERSPVAKFHVLLQGTALLTAGGAAPVPLGTGDLVLLPHGDGHIIADQPGSPVRQLDAILADHSVDEAGWLSYGGSGRRTRLLCGGFELGPSLPDDLADFLPPVLRLDADTGLVRWLEPLFALLKDGDAGQRSWSRSDLRETCRRVRDPGAAQLPGRSRRPGPARAARSARS
jgi:hypothetical protein